MEALECIRTRVAVRDFRDDPVPGPALRTILEAGRLAGSSKNTQPWHFVVIQERETLRRLSDLTPTGPHLARAPLAIAVATIGAKMPEVDGSRAIQNMMLAAWDLGLGTCWITNFDERRVKELLGLPGDAVFLTAFPVGYPRQRVTGRRKRRKPLEEIVHWERFGQRGPAGHGS